MPYSLRANGPDRRHLEQLEARTLLSSHVSAEASSPPVVLNVYLSGTAWSASFKQHIGGNGYDSATHGAWIGPPSTEGASSPWSNVDQITVQFSTDMLVESRHLRVVGAAVGEYPVASFTYLLDTLNFTGIAAWTLSRALSADRILLDLDGDSPGGVRQPGSNVHLDGDRDGQPGGDFRLRFDSLPGDQNRDGHVVAPDLYSVRASVGTSVTHPGVVPTFYSARGDVNADGRINSQDVAEVRRRLGTSLPDWKSAGLIAPRSRARPVTRGLFSEAPVLKCYTS